MTLPPSDSLPPDRTPAFNVPGPLLVLVGLLVAIHVWRSFVQGLWTDSDVALLKLLALVPARVSVALGLVNVDSLLVGIQPDDIRLKTALVSVFVVDQGAGLWTFITSALLHGGTEHLILNCLWLIVFGTPVIRRFGTVRFALLFLASAFGGSLLYYLMKPSDVSVLIGASGAISGLTAAAMRFCFSRRGFSADEDAIARPALSLVETLTQRPPLTFLIVWLAINLIMGLIGPAMSGGSDIAWQAHLGGFLAGLLLFGVLDPVGDNSL